MTAEERLTDALRAEYAAIYAYGVLGAHLEGPTVALARQADLAHRARRDALLVRLAAGAPQGSATPSATTPAGQPPAAEPAYALPGRVTDQASALNLAVLVEERTAAVWRAALPDTAGTDRRLALDALLDCAVRATRTRRSAGVQPSTVAFPGRP